MRLRCEIRGLESGKEQNLAHPNGAWNEIRTGLRLFPRNHSAGWAEGCPFPGYAGQWARAKEKSHAACEL